MIGTVIGNYQIVQKLGKGGMGAVYLGQHTLLGRRAAIKVLLPDLSARTDAVNRLFNEARAVTSISDPGIVQIFDFGYHNDGRAFIVMEFLEGEPLDRRLARLGRLPVDEALRLCRQIASSLASAHARHIIHRDLKPENIFLVRDREVASGERPKIVDFGVAKLSDDHPGKVKTRTGTLVGTPRYMSPEQCRGVTQIDHRADIYSLGCVLFHLLSGRTPFDGEGVGDIISAHIREPAPAPSSRAPGIPPGVDALVLRCLAKAPADRFQTMDDLAAAIGSLEGATATPITPIMPGTPGPGPSRLATTAPGSGRLGFWIVASLVFGAIGTGIAVVGTRSNKPEVMDDVATHRGTNSETAIDAGEAAAMGSGPPAPATAVIDAGEVAVVGSGSPVPATVVDSAVATNTLDDRDTEKAQKAKKCIELQAAKYWQDLVDCAKGLEALGDKERATSFKNKAVTEQANQLKAADVQLKLREHNLKDAAALLTQIGNDSVYYKSLHDQFLEEENTAVEEARRKAQGFANAHNCPALKRYATQLSVSTERVVAAAQAVKCTDGSGSATPNAGKPGCDTMNVDDLVGQAAAQYSNGHADAALSQMAKALGCRQNVQMYRFAATYACAAHDSSSAKVYFAKVPPQFQSAIEQKCQQESTPLR